MDPVLQVSNARRCVLRHWVQLTVAGWALAGAVASWSWVRTVVDVAPVAAGQPATTSVAYYPPLLVLTLVLATTAGVLAVLGVAGLRRLRTDGSR